MLAFLNVKEMYGLIVAGADQMLALVVEIQRCHIFSTKFFLGSVETLHKSIVRIIYVRAGPLKRTFIGRKVRMVSDNFWNWRGAWAEGKPCWGVDA
jgi:hypothetical protein